ncbi:MAG: type II toxin-antitoxin system RelE/ParE family toxin [Desulfuromonadales bacterium]|jgi:toxin ParE1/3/4|nr:type II toxin-antitoxin system RelE/ParE family toxin [Desulfuromonadales bacterium]
MRRVVLSPKAKVDLSQVWDYTYAEWGAEQAEKYIRELWAVIEEQSIDLIKSVDISDVRKGYRKVRSGSHVIFFKVTQGGVLEVVRILHQEMDFDRHL